MFSFLPSVDQENFFSIEQDNRIELTLKHSRWVSHNKTTHTGTHDGIVRHECIKPPGGNQLHTAAPLRPPSGGQPHQAAPHSNTKPYFTDESKFHSILNSYVYTAYYDDRRSGPAFIRILTLLKKTERPALFCHFANPNTGETERKYLTVIVTYYEMCENHGKLPIY